MLEFIFYFFCYLLAFSLFIYSVLEWDYIAKKKKWKLIKIKHIGFLFLPRYRDKKKEIDIDCKNTIGLVAFCITIFVYCFSIAYLTISAVAVFGQNETCAYIASRSIIPTFVVPSVSAVSIGLYQTITTK
ncbi:MAG: hypothetical protein H6687_02930 [Bacillales bacterium]|nr:hypothetical protein [Bacillales bacterium]